ncbi:TetR/AcrR family transcriptional regulator [Pseudonocardia nigra]|uniref:TetR/AcrR family transcriptional regulator n=1 Tax=Pseudonocardia nigra TaxID=1921578 RepID=UPI001C5E0A1E|nr:TetR/AcrR family transcriptional regulator [Pseudonocardia nigra]
MGHREDLLAGAKRCLAEKGYARTTARDIVAASGTNLASIGYHFGSKDALLTAAVIDWFDDWDDEIEQALHSQRDREPAERLSAFLDAVLHAATSDRALAGASLQAAAQAEYSDELRDQLGEAYNRGRRAFAAMLLQVEESEIDDERGRAIGSLGLALVNGMVLQWLIDPERAPSGSELAAAIRVLLTPRT